ncbi:MAG: hypothetical protein ACK5NY_04325 [Burkholderiaceae bacterium]
MTQTDHKPPKSNAAFSHVLLDTVETLAQSNQATEMARFYELSPEDQLLSQQLGSSENLNQPWSAIYGNVRDQIKARHGYFNYQKQELTHFSKKMSPEESSGKIRYAEEKKNFLAPSLLVAAHTEPACNHDCHAHGGEGDGSEAPHAHAHAHDHAGGVIAVDLDEAAHALYAVSRYVTDVIQNGPSSLPQAVRDDAQALGENPLHAFRNEMLPHGVADFVAAVTASLGVLPLAGLAISAGVHEIQHAAAALKKLGKTEAQLREKQIILERLGNTLLTSGYAKELRAQARKDLSFAKKLARSDFGIGLSSALSGTAIAAKSIIDLVVNAAAVALTKKFIVTDMVNQYAGIGLAATISGAAGTLVFGPLAGVFAASLGVFFVRKSTAKLSQLRQDFKSTQADLRWLLGPTEQNDPVAKAYKAFIEKQGKKRISFFKRFSRWNKVFMTGSGLYAASATTKMVVASVALAGIGALSITPVGWALLGVGIVGAVVMGVGSLMFFKGHPIQGRYSGHTAADHSSIDREFLASLDRLPMSVEKTPQAAFDAATVGFNLRAQCLQWLDTRKKALEVFIKKAAVANDKLPPVFANKAAVAKGKRPPRHPQVHVWHKLFCLARVGYRYSVVLAATFSHKQAVERSRSERMSSRRDLGSRHIEAWIETEEGLTALLELAEKDLNAKAVYLEKKLQVRLKVFAESSVVVSGASVSDLSYQAYRQLMSEQDEGVERDQANYEKCRTLLKKVEVFKSSLAASSPANSSTAANSLNARQQLLRGIGEYFGMSVQVSPDVSPSRLLSKLLAKDLYKDIKNCRGILFEAQLQTSRVRQNVAIPTDDVLPPDASHDHGHHHHH